MIKVIIFLFISILSVKCNTSGNITEYDISKQISMLQQTLTQNIINLENKMDLKFLAIDQRFQAIDLKFQAVDQKISEISQKMTTEFYHLDTKFELLKNKFETINFWQTFLISPSWIVLISILSYTYGHFGWINIKLMIIKCLPESFIRTIIEINKAESAEERKNN
jgi:hypothetical protein